MPNVKSAANFNSGEPMFVLIIRPLTRGMEQADIMCARDLGVAKGIAQSRHHAHTDAHTTLTWTHHDKDPWGFVGESYIASDRWVRYEIRPAQVEEERVAAGGIPHA